MKSKCSSRLPSLQAVYSLLVVFLALIISCSVVGCSPAQDAGAHPDGGHGGRAPPAPRGGPVHHMCPEPECRLPGAPPPRPPPPPPVAPHRKIGRSW